MKESADKQGEEPSKKYVVYVDDNFHLGDESERYKHGEYDSCEEAVATCKEIVDSFFEQVSANKFSFDEIYTYGYTMFGEDPFIVSEDESCRFSAWDYAKKRSLEICT